MAKRKSKVIKKTPKAAKPLSVIDRLPKTEKAYINRLIELSLRNVKGNGSDLDNFFLGQAERMAKRRDALKD